MLEDFIASRARNWLNNTPDIRPSIRTAAFIKQNEYLDNRYKYRERSLCCPRRSAKTTSDVIDNIEIGFAYPNSRMIYGALTVETAFDLVWDIYGEFNEKFDLGLKQLKGTYKIEFPNGSIVQLIGLNSSEKEMKKILGRKLRKASIDEAGSITVGLEKIVKQMIRPALEDLRPNSWLTILGTPEDIPNTYFEKVDTGKDKDIGWQRFHWTAHDNPYMAKQWKQAIDEILERNPDAVNASWFKTHYLGQWCADANKLIINYNKEKHSVTGIQYRTDWFYILGVDLGFNDASSFSVLCWSMNHPILYIIKSYRKKGMDFTDVANEIKYLEKRFPFSHYIIDGANKQGVEELRIRHQIPLTPAEKQDKPTFLRMMRDDLAVGRVKVLQGECETLEEEWQSLLWEDERWLKEDARCENHCSDGIIYAWRYARAYLWKPQDKPLGRNTQEYMDKHELEEGEKWEQQKKNRIY